MWVKDGKWGWVFKTPTQTHHPPPITHPAMKKDEFWMRRALALAEKGRGRTGPNPLVGAVAVKSGRLLAEGYHAKLGGPHAEVAALRRSGPRAKGATLYVTLEPCVHWGRTGPCIEKILKSGVRRVVVAMRDPNPLVNGRGIRRLRQAGFSLKVGVLEKEVQELNRPFMTYMTQHRPYVTVKAAQSLDGKIATRSGDSRWISGPQARRFVHRLREEVDAIAIGVNTVLKDDPLLLARPNGKRSRHQPKRIVLDRYLRTPLSATLVRSASVSPVILAIGKDVSQRKMRPFLKTGVQFLKVATDRDRIDLKELLRKLAAMEISRLLMEGGGTLIGEAFDKKVVDELYLFIAPKVVGGKGAPTAIEGKGISKITQALPIRGMQWQQVGQDFLIHGWVS